MPPNVEKMMPKLGKLYEGLCKIPWVGVPTARAWNRVMGRLIFRAPEPGGKPKDSIGGVKDYLLWSGEEMGFPFEIIGILEDEQFRSHTRKALAIDDRSQEVYIPYTTSMRTFGTGTYMVRSGSREHTEVELDQIIVQAKSADQVFTTSQMIAALLKKFHDKKEYEIIVPLELLKQSEETQKVFNIFMVVIAGISLLVGGIGIANIMLATITERTKEIGIRRALGAQRKDILIQFLTETVAIAALGGLLGSLFGVAGILGIVEFTQWKALIAPHYIVISLLISCTVGILFGIFPARRAAMMDPITALRYE